MSRIPMTTVGDLIFEQYGVRCEQHITYGDDGGVTIFAWKDLADGRRQYAKSRLVRWREFEEWKQVGSFLYPSEPTHASRCVNTEKMNRELERVGQETVMALVEQS
jgi:hypothetical protein